MLQITVLHMTISAFRNNVAVDIGYERDAIALTEAVRERLADGSYQRVATVDGNLNEAWRLTNSVDEAWFENYPSNIKPVDFAKNEGCRSSMVGDLFVVEGVVHVAASIGFRTVEGDFSDLLNKVEDLKEQF